MSMAKSGKRSKFVQGPAKQWEATLDSGETIIITYPDTDPTQDVTWMKANADSFTTEGNNVHNILIAPTAEGLTGILVTHLNSCEEDASLNKCARPKCKYFHFPPGYIVSNLPNREPQVVGQVHPAIAAKTPYDALVVWDPKKARNIALTRTTQMAELKQRRRAMREAMATKATEDEEYAELMREVQGVSEPVAKRARIALRPQREIEDLPRLMYQPAANDQGPKQQEPKDEAGAANMDDQSPKQQEPEGEAGAAHMDQDSPKQQEPEGQADAPNDASGDAAEEGETAAGLEEQNLIKQGPAGEEEIVPDANAVIDANNRIIINTMAGV